LYGNVPVIQHEIVDSSLDGQQQTSSHSSLNDEPHQEEGDEFDISIIAEAQKADKLYQEKIREIKNNSSKCLYTLDDRILYKLLKLGLFVQKLIYVPPSMLKKLLNAYHDAPWTGHFGFRRTYFKLKDKYW